MLIPFCITACKATSLSFLSCSEAQIRFRPSRATDFKTTSFSFLRYSDAYFRLPPFCVTACQTTSLSFWSCFDAYWRFNPFCETICKTPSLSFHSSFDTLLHWEYRTFSCIFLLKFRSACTLALASDSVMPFYSPFLINFLSMFVWFFMEGWTVILWT